MSHAGGELAHQRQHLFHRESAAREGKSSGRMARMFMSSVVMGVLLAAPAQPAPPARTQPLTWKVTGSDVTFEMSSTDLRGLRDGKEVFGLQSREADFSSGFEADEGTDTSGWEGFESIKVLSVVGPWVSYEESSSGYSGGAHPYASTSYGLTDLTKGSKGFSLLEVFSEKEVLKALKADGFVRKHISDKEAFKNAKTVAAMLESLEPGYDCVGFRYGLSAVEHFVAFHHVEGNKVAVRISFGYDNETCRGNKFVVGVLLPIPASLRPALDRAARREEGFLMKDAEAVGAPSVKVSWEPPEPKKE